jgi:hypothetical protein
MAGTALGPDGLDLFVGPGTGFGISIGLSAGLGISIGLSSGLGVSVRLGSGLGVSVRLCSVLGVSVRLGSVLGVSLGSGIGNAWAVADLSRLSDSLGVDLSVGVAFGFGAGAGPPSELGGGPGVAHQVSEDVFHGGGPLVRDGRQQWGHLRIDRRVESNGVRPRSQHGCTRCDEAACVFGDGVLGHSLTHAHKEDVEGRVGVG